MAWPSPPHLAQSPTMPKRPASDAMQAVMAPSRAEAVPGLKSRSGRVVKPKVKGGEGG